VNLEEMREPDPLEFEVRPRTLKTEVRTESLYRAFVAQCCTALGVGVDELLAMDKGCRQVCEARKFVAWALRDRWRLSYTQLARALNRKDHTTMISSVNRFQRAIDNREFWALQLVERCEFTTRSEIQIETALESLSAMRAVGT
jgi:chromosomal replication initiation ATPase DnaA